MNGEAMTSYAGPPLQTSGPEVSIAAVDIIAEVAAVVEHVPPVCLVMHVTGQVCDIGCVWRPVVLLPGVLWWDVLLPGVLW